MVLYIYITHIEAMPLCTQELIASGLAYVYIYIYDGRVLCIYFFLKKIFAILDFQCFDCVFTSHPCQMLSILAGVLTMLYIYIGADHSAWH